MGLSRVSNDCLRGETILAELMPCVGYTSAKLPAWICRLTMRRAVDLVEPSDSLTWGGDDFMGMI